MKDNEVQEKEKEISRIQAKYQELEVQNQSLVQKMNTVHSDITEQKKDVQELTQQFFSLKEV